MALVWLEHERSAADNSLVNFVLLQGVLLMRALRFPAKTTLMAAVLVLLPGPG